MLFEVSKRLTIKNIRDLGLKLGIEGHLITTALTDNANALSSAAYNVLMDWLNRQNDRESAYDALRKALKAAQLNLIAHEVL